MEVRYPRPLTVYMLQCADDKIYIGVTNNLEKRIGEHNCGTDKKAYTYKRRPIRLIWCCEFQSQVDAITAEKQLKGWSRAKKLALANGETDLLANLAKKSFD